MVKDPYSFDKKWRYEMSDNTIYAYLKPLTKVPDNYEIKLLSEPVPFYHSYKGWVIYTRNESDPFRLRITEQVAQYNRIVQTILDTSGFLSFFIKNNLLVTKEQISDEFSNELADLIFTMQEYSFIHQLRKLKKL